MGRARHVARSYWFDALLALLVLEAMLETVLERHSSAAPRTLWFALPAIGILALTVAARRRFPFAAPTACGALAAAIAFVAWRVIPFAVSLFVVGLAVSFLLGNLRNGVQAAAGLV